MKKYKDSIFKNFKDIIGILIGTMICGFAYTFFLIPFKASPGGIGGISQILFHLYNFKAGLSMFLINIPLYIIGIIIFGKMFGIKSLFGIISLSFFIDFFSMEKIYNLYFLKPFLFKISENSFSFTNDIFLAVLYGAIISGIGFGITLNFKGSSGGSDIIALILRKYLGITIGNGYFMIDSIIIFTTGIIFKNANLILWGLISLFICSKVVDFVLEGNSHTKAAFIISNKTDEIKNYIIKELDRGCTILKAEGGYTNEKRDVIYTTITIRELARLKEIIKLIDNEAFVVVNNVNQVVGLGFRKFD